MANDQPQSQTTPASLYREFARAFLALHFDPDSSPFKCGVEILCRALEQAREEGYRYAEAYSNGSSSPVSQTRNNPLIALSRPTAG